MDVITILPTVKKSVHGVDALNHADATIIPRRERMNKIIVVYQPVFDSILPSEKVIQKTLKPRDSYEKAEEALKEALLHEQSGSNGQIEKFFVCVEDETGIITPPDAGKLILPN